MTTTIKKYAPTAVDWDMILASLNEKFKTLTPKERLERLFALFRDSDIMITTSFGTKSIFLLNLLNEVRPGHPVHFIDTGYHFQQTLEYKDKIVDALHLNLITLKPNAAQHALTKEEKWWNEHPNMCCTINKIVPLEPVVNEHKVWISSLMSGQTARRARLDIFNKQGTILKFHPIIDMDEKTFKSKIEVLDLEPHPLAEEGYGSIGCTHCTSKGQGRAGRWNGKRKTECGLHTRYYRGNNQ